MAKVIKNVFSNSNINTWYDFFNSLNCPILSVSISGSYVVLNIDNDKVVINLGMGQTWIKPISVAYNGSTTNFGNPDFPYAAGITVNVCFTDSLLFIRMVANNGSGVGDNKGMTLLYKKTSDNYMFGYITRNNNVDIKNINLNDPNGITYNYIDVLAYTRESGYIDYLDYSLLGTSNQMGEKDLDLKSCTEITSDSVITFGGKNYYSLGSRVIAQIDN